ncbi:MAG: phosphodiester glycosidase family protein [Pseudonocardia sp.]
MRAGTWVRRALTVGATGLVATSVLASPAVAAPAGYDGVSHREFSTTAGGRPVMGDVVEVDLTKPKVRVELLDSGALASRATVTDMADDVGAVAAINGDFFDIGRSGAPAGPAVQDGTPLKAAVPQGRRAAPPVAGAEPDYVFSVGQDGKARIDRLRLQGTVTSAKGEWPIVALNQHAVPVGGIGVFTNAWGAYDRAKTMCGSDTDRTAPCAAQRVEVLIRDGVVVSSGPATGGAIKPGDTVLVGRDEGAAKLRGLTAGDKATVDYRLVPASGVAPRFAVGGMPIVADGQAIPNPIANRERAPRSAAGLSADGKKIMLVTVDGRQSDSGGMTLPEFARQLAAMGVHAAVNLDGGGSSTLVYRAPGASRASIVNDPADKTLRLVANSIGVSIG